MRMYIDGGVNMGVGHDRCASLQFEIIPADLTWKHDR
jgi:hypothetical protein